MQRALSLAANGRFYVSPNPMVGAVIVNGSGEIIGEGFHRRCGEAHAEVNAVKSVRNLSQLHDSTMYVTLEPCSHYGKTPPCAQLIIDCGIPRVVIGCLDPFEKVSGRGVSMLKDAGIEVVVGVMEQECRELNYRFMLAHRLQRPMIVLKWAQSVDGWMDCKRDLECGAMKFSSQVTSMLVHKLRASVDAILVGPETVVNDNPRLNTRLWNGRDARVVLIDRSEKIAADAYVLERNPLYLAPQCRDSIKDSVEWVAISREAEVVDWIGELYKRGITSLLVEGGAKILRAFIDSGLWDVARVETSPVRLGDKGVVSAPVFGQESDIVAEIEGNMIAVYANKCNFNCQKKTYCNFV